MSACLLTHSALRGEDLHAPVCSGCHKPITREGTRAIERPWHRQCLKCSVCCQVLPADFFERDNRVYCEKDFRLRFSPDHFCDACQGVIASEELVEDGGKCYHGRRGGPCCVEALV